MATTSPAGHLRRDPAPKVVTMTSHPTMAGKFTGKQVSAFAREVLKGFKDFHGFGDLSTCTIEAQHELEDRVCPAMKIDQKRFHILWYVCQTISAGWTDAWGRLQLLGPRDTYTVRRTADGAWWSVNTQYAKG